MHMHASRRSFPGNSRCADLRDRMPLRPGVAMKKAKVVVQGTLFLLFDGEIKAAVIYNLHPIRCVNDARLSFIGDENYPRVLAVKTAYDTCTDICCF